MLVVSAGYFIVNSKLGRLMVAIRDKEDRVRFSGYDVANIKTVVFCISALFSAIGGAMFTLQVGFMSPGFIGTVASIEMVVFCAVGGRGSLLGAVYGALIVNAAKSSIDKPKGIKYLGFGFYFDSFAKEYRARPHDKSVAKFRARMKELTRRSWGVDNAYKVMKLNQLIRGWINYFKIGSMKVLCERLDENIRFRLRMCIWKHWKTPKNRAKNLIKLGVSRKYAWTPAYYGAHIAYVCQRGAMNIAVTKKRLGRFGLISMLDYYEEKRVTC